MNGTLAIVASIAGVTIQKSLTKTGDKAQAYGNANDEISLPAATALLTYINDEDDTATATLSPGHGLSTGVYDLYWADGVRYGVTCTITTNAVDIPDSGAGDALPIDDTECNISEQIDINTAIDGDNVSFIAMNATKRSHVDFFDDTPASVEAIELLADEPYLWHDTNGITNPFTGDPIESAKVSNGDTAAASILTVLTLEDSTP